ncbi:MAG: mechanosensitive ion channel protein MscS, partial [Bacteroidetes bacterium QH_10_64_19]
MNDLLSQSQNYLNAETIQMLGSYLLSIIAFILILVIGRYVATWTRNLIRSGLDRPKMDTTLTK